MNTKLYVGNLSFNTTEMQLQDAFAAHGPVSEVNLMVDRATGRSRGFAFVTMGTPEAAQAAIGAMHGARLDGRELTVNEARPKEDRPRGGGFGGGGGGQAGQQGGGGQSGTVQLPVIATISVSTVVSVPDGGTVLLGGIKRLREGRNMAGVPILNKIPYISRLFKNSGVGRETESVMLMVTPRIIIQEEEEELIIGTTLE